MNEFYVIEIQSHRDGTSGNLVTGFPDRNTFEDCYMQTRAAANDSSVWCHTVMWIDNEGRNMEPPKCYHHAEPIPGQEEQGE